MKNTTDRRRYLVYMATNRVNGKRYIGATSLGLDSRRRLHLQHARAERSGCRIFMAAIRRYGEGAFEWKAIATAKSFNGMMKREIKLIAQLAPEYNITKGGEGGSFPRTQETKDKTSRSLMGHEVTLETRAKLTGLKQSAKTIKKLRKLGFERIDTFRKYSHLGPMASSKKVIRVDTNEIYPSASEAARVHGVSKSMIIELCCHNPRRKTVKGLVFRYLGEMAE